MTNFHLSNQDYDRLQEILKKHFEVVNKSPYSNSFYNSKDIDWGHKPEGSYRIADHWNFKGHCVTWNEVENDTHLSIGIFREGKYDIIESFELKRDVKKIDTLYKGLTCRDYESLNESFDIDAFVTTEFGIDFSEEYIFYTEYDKRSEEFLKDILLIEGNGLYLKRPFFSWFGWKYIGSLYVEVRRICDDESIDDNIKIEKLIELKEGIENVA